MVSVGTSVGMMTEPPPPREDAALGSVVALAVALSVGAFLVAGPLLWVLMPITELPAPLPDTHQDAETLGFLVAFGLLLPAGIVAALRVSRRIAAGPNSGSLSPLVASLTAGLAVVVLATRISTELPWGGGPGLLAGLASLWWAAAGVAIARAASDREWPGAAVPARRRARLWGITAVLVTAAALSFFDVGSASRPALAIGLGVAAAVLLGHGHVHVPTPSRRVGAAVDAVLVVLLVLAVPNVVVLVTGDPSARFETTIVQFHQDFYLGPANQILAGDAMLVDVLSQYGVGSIYFLAGVFLLIPIGNGTLGLIEGALSAAMFIATFAALRIAGVSRLVAGTSMAVGVVALVYGLEYPLGGLLQHGAFRFGLPVGVILGAAVEARWPRAAVPARGLQLVTVAVASVWALEAFAYTMLTAVAVVAFQVAVGPAGRRRRVLLPWVWQIGAAGLIAHVVLALATLGATGSLPDWGWYIHTLREFLAGGIGDLTYDFSTFSWGLLLGAVYLASGAALAVVLVRRPDLVPTERTILVVIAGTTAHGVALFSYLVNRSADHIIPYVALPAVALGALWLTFIGRPSVRADARGARAALAGAMALSVALVAVAWPGVGHRYSQSALAHAIPGGDSLPEALDRLRDRPPILDDAVEAEELLERFMPGERRSIVLTGADLSIEALMRSGRASAVPFGDPVEDSFVPDGHFEPLADFVDGLNGGERMLLDLEARAAFDRYRRDPSLDPLVDVGEESLVPGLAPLQRWVLRAMGERFDLRTVTATATGLEVVELVERPGTA